MAAGSLRGRVAGGGGKREGEWGDARLLWLAGWVRGGSCFYSCISDGSQPKGVGRTWRMAKDAEALVRGHDADGLAAHTQRSRHLGAATTNSSSRATSNVTPTTEQASLPLSQLRCATKSRRSKPPRPSAQHTQHSGRPAQPRGQWPRGQCPRHQHPVRGARCNRASAPKRQHRRPAFHPRARRRLAPSALHVRQNPASVPPPCCRQRRPPPLPARQPVRSGWPTRRRRRRMVQVSAAAHRAVPAAVSKPARPNRVRYGAQGCGGGARGARGGGHLVHVEALVAPQHCQHGLQVAHVRVRGRRRLQAGGTDKTGAAPPA